MYNQIIIPVCIPIAEVISCPNDPTGSDKNLLIKTQLAAKKIAVP